MADELTDETSPAEEHSPEVWREGITMALYISLSLLAVMVALPTDQVENSANLALTVAVTAIGLVLAHQLAFRLSTRLVTPGSGLDAHSLRLLKAQLLGGAAVTVVAAVPVLLFGVLGYRIAMGLLVVFVMAVGYQAARSKPASRLRSLLYVLGVGVGIMIIVFVKNLVHH